MKQKFPIFLMKGEVKLFFLGLLKQNPAETEVADCKDVVVRAHQTPLSTCCSVVCLLHMEWRCGLLNLHVSSIICETSF